MAHQGVPAPEEPLPSESEKYGSRPSYPQETLGRLQSRRRFWQDVAN